MLDETVLASDEDRHADRRRLRDIVVSHDEWQGERGRLVAGAWREIGRRFHIGEGRIGGEGEARPPPVGHYVDVWITGWALWRRHRGRQLRIGRGGASRGAWP